MLSELKLLLGITDDDRDDMLRWILESAEARLSILLGGMDVPEELKHIVVEAAVVRFNRIGSEGYSTHTVEGETIALSDNDFAGFTDEIEAYLDEAEGVKKGRVRFI